MKNKIYLDYNATAPARPEIIAHVSALMHTPHNASSVHSYGREARKHVELARERVAELCGAPASQVIFNSGATEGNNTVLAHFKNETIAISAIEHPSVIEAAKEYAAAVEIIPVTQDGILDLGALEAMLQKIRPSLVSVMAVNNETGVIQPVQKIAALAHSYGALYHCDGVQAAGRIPLNVPELGIDFLTLSSHKIAGPQGAGALVLGLCGATPTLLYGGGQEKRARAGTENVAGIAGFGLAAQHARGNMAAFQDLAALRDKIESGIIRSIPGAQIHGAGAPRVANTTLFTVPGVPSETLLMAFDLEGIALSNGSACSSGKVEPSHVLTAMGLGADRASSALRVSLGWNTNDSDIEAFIHVCAKIAERLKDKISAHG